MELQNITLIPKHYEYPIHFWNQESIFFQIGKYRVFHLKYIGLLKKSFIVNAFMLFTIATFVFTTFLHFFLFVMLYVFHNVTQLWIVLKVKVLMVNIQNLNDMFLFSKCFLIIQIFSNSIFGYLVNNQNHKIQVFKKSAILGIWRLKKTYYNLKGTNIFVNTSTLTFFSKPKHDSKLSLLLLNFSQNKKK